jgi:hypothetical protein
VLGQEGEPVLIELGYEPGYGKVLVLAVYTSEDGGQQPVVALLNGLLNIKRQGEGSWGARGWLRAASTARARPYSHAPRQAGRY